jgi:hypothetical protein
MILVINEKHLAVGNIIARILLDMVSENKIPSQRNKTPNALI